MLNFIFFILANFLMCVFVAALLNVLIIASHQAFTGGENKDLYGRSFVILLIISIIFRLII